MKGDFHVRFCERLKLKCFGLLDQLVNSPTAQSLERYMPPIEKNY
jgi:hypothetical protein